MKSMFVLFTGLIVAVDRFSPILSDALSALCASMQKEWDNLMCDLSVAKEQVKSYRKLYNDAACQEKIEKRITEDAENYNKRLRDEIKDYSNLVDDEGLIWEVVIPHTWISKHKLSAVRILRDTFRASEESELQPSDAKRTIEYKISLQDDLFNDMLSTKEMLVVVRNLNHDELKNKNAPHAWDGWGGIQIKIVR